MSLSNYIKGNKLGEGTWGHVFESTRRSDGLRVAIKRIKPINSQVDGHLPPGVNFTALREIKYLQELKLCPNIIKVTLLNKTKIVNMN
jgi:serine/threonine protein kinase